ncbi:RHS repeat-associated core domain-containing protein [uncultured Capnocytophaga sp.]|uniref:RHS repeat domain-containing protein n=1 Tax=uncultured Capnocytophaga sp. TaxID=159273 RepID=UPI00260627DB|nr:RHS repeat-associated core domain-containing protein [uncultured Capnocytophaga sp.]
MLTDEDGNIAERRHFDPWGHPIKVEDGAGKVLQGLTLLDRGFTGHEHLQTIGLIHMNGRLYDPALHRFLQPDNYVQDPFNTQNFNRYGYVLNNPLLYTDPTGEYILVDDIVAAVFGGIINLTVNAIQGNLGGHGFWGGVGRGFAAFGAGALAGWGALYPEFGGWLWGGGVVGATNAWLGGATKAEDIALGAGIGVVSSVVGGAASSLANKGVNLMINGLKVTSPIVKGVVNGLIGGFAGGYASGFVVGYMETGNLNYAHHSGMFGAKIGAPLGIISGVSSSLRYSSRNNLNPWTGERIISEGEIVVRHHTSSEGLYSIKKNEFITPSRVSDYNFIGTDFEATPNFKGIQNFGQAGKGAFIELVLPKNILVPSPSPTQPYYFRVNTGFDNNFIIKPSYKPQYYYNIKF